MTPPQNKEMTKNYLTKLFELADKVLPVSVEALRKNGMPFCASELNHFYGFLEAMRDEIEKLDE